MLEELFFHSKPTIPLRHFAAAVVDAAAATTKKKHSNSTVCCGACYAVPSSPLPSVSLLHSNRQTRPIRQDEKIESLVFLRRVAKRMMEFGIRLPLNFCAGCNKIERAK